MRTWTRTTDALPQLLVSDPNAWRAESEWMLVRRADGGVWVAQYYQDAATKSGATGWAVRGSDCHDIGGVVEWMEIPA